MKSIARNLSVSLSATIIIVCMLFFGVYYGIQTIESHELSQSRLDEVVERLSGNLGYHLWNVNEGEVATICEVYRNSELLEWIEVRDEMDRVIYQSGTQSEGNAYTKTQFIIYQDIMVGSVSVSLNTAHNAEIRQNTVLIVLLIMMLTSVSVFMVIQYTLRRFFSSPISHLHQQIDRIMEGNFQSTLNENVDLELVPITKAVNQLSERLKVRDAEIQEYTSQLEHTNQQLQKEILERKNVEEQLIQSQKMEAIGTLAGGVAHDFNNIIMVISGYCEMANMQLKPDDPVLEDIQHINEASQKAAGLTKQLLAFSRKQIVKPQVVNINKQIENAHVLLSRLLGEDISFELHLKPHVKPIKIDPGQFEQVIINIAVNARDAMPKGGSFLIESTMVFVDEKTEAHKAYMKHGEYVVISFSDNGTGMPKEMQHKIFDPFFTTKGKSEGTGLGLSTVFGIIKQNDGYISVYSEEGKGTTFKIYFPVTLDEVPEESILKQNATILHGNESILVVEDDVSICNIIAKTLLDNGYKVETAHHEGEVNQLLVRQNFEFDLLVTDVILPKKGGREIAQQLQARIPNLQVIFMSGYTDNAIAHHNIIDEGVNFIQKPFRPVELLQLIRDVLDAKE